jgi:hypothetical protein
MFSEPELPINWPNGLQAIRVELFKQSLLIAKLTEIVHEMQHDSAEDDDRPKRGRPFGSVNKIAA